MNGTFGVSRTNRFDHAGLKRGTFDWILERILSQRPDTLPGTLFVTRPSSSKRIAESENVADVLIFRHSHR